MLLKNKQAVIYGGGGSMAGAIARAFAKEGATIFATGRTIEALQKLVDEITKAGGKATATVVDAMNEKEVNNHLEAVLKEAGQIDISFNAIGIEDKQNIALTNMLLDDFIRPVNKAMQTQFITATAAGRAMMKQKTGIILSLTATPGGIGYAMVGGFGPACCAMESFSRDLASELGPYSVKVVNIRSGGSPDSKPFKEAIKADPDRANLFLTKMKEDTMLKALPMMNDIANVAVFLASDMASKITGVTIDVTAGTTAALNYKTTDVAFAQK